MCQLETIKILTYVIREIHLWTRKLDKVQW